MNKMAIQNTENLQRNVLHQKAVLSIAIKRNSCCDSRKTPKSYVMEWSPQSPITENVHSFVTFFMNGFP